MLIWLCALSERWFHCFAFIHYGDWRVNAGLTRPRERRQWRKGSYFGVHNYIPFNTQNSIHLFLHGVSADVIEANEKLRSVCPQLEALLDQTNFWLPPESTGGATDSWICLISPLCCFQLPDYAITGNMTDVSMATGDTYSIKIAESVEGLLIADPAISKRGMHVILSLGEFLIVVACGQAPGSSYLNGAGKFMYFFRLPISWLEWGWNHLFWSLQRVLQITLYRGMPCGVLFCPWVICPRVICDFWVPLGRQVEHWPSISKVCKWVNNQDVFLSLGIVHCTLVCLSNLLSYLCVVSSA